MDMDRRSVPFADLTLREFTGILASSQPVPGGGSAAAVAGALAASLVEMVASLSLGRARFEDYQDTLERGGQMGRNLNEQFLSLADRDARAYAAYSAALKLPRDSAEQQAARAETMAAAAKAAAEVPWECVRACTELAVTAESLAGRSNANAASDLLVAALLAEAGARGAAENVRVNLPGSGDEEYAETMQRQLDEALHDVASLTSRTREVILSGRTREPEEE